MSDQIRVFSVDDHPLLRETLTDHGTVVGTLHYLPPEAITMAVVGVLALAVNFSVAAMLYRFREGDANMRSVWLCTRNDVIANLAVYFATQVLFPDGVSLRGLDLFALVVAAVSFVVLQRYKVPIYLMVPAGALVGMAWTLL